MAEFLCNASADPVTDQSLGQQGLWVAYPSLAIAINNRAKPTGPLIGDSFLRPRLGRRV